MKKLIFFILIIAACTPQNTKTIEKQAVNKKPTEIQEIADKNSKYYESLEFAKTINQTDTSTFILIEKTIAIIILPDSSWLNEQQKEIGEEGWNEVVADHDYYQSDAIDILEKKGIEVKFFDTNKQYFKFIKSDKSIFCIDKTKMKDKWGLILFNTAMDPVFWLDTSIDEALNDIYLK